MSSLFFSYFKFPLFFLVSAFLFVAEFKVVVSLVDSLHDLCRGDLLAAIELHVDAHLLRDLVGVLLLPGDGLHRRLAVHDVLDVVRLDHLAGDAPRSTDDDVIDVFAREDAKDALVDVHDGVVPPLALVDVFILMNADNEVCPEFLGLLEQL